VNDSPWKCHKAVVSKPSSAEQQIIIYSYATIIIPVNAYVIEIKENIVTLSPHFSFLPRYKLKLLPAGIKKQ